jgi:hypothetical protein
MRIDISSDFPGLARVMDGYLSKYDRALNEGTKGMELSIGLAKDDRYGVPAHAASSPVYAGDSAHILGKRINPVVESLLKTHPEQVAMDFAWDADKKGWWVEFKARPAGDAAPDFIAGQQFSPWNISFFKTIFKEPLSYSNFKRAVRMDNGTNPWTEIFSLFYRHYAGFAAITGRMSDQSTNDVNVIDGLMSAAVINMMVTWTNTIEEIKRSEVRGNPFGRSSLAEKPSYARYALDMLSEYLGWYGNRETDTMGILNINPIEIWAGQSMKDIFNSTVITEKGSLIYRTLADIINQFIVRADGKFKKLNIFMSPEAWSYISSAPYSDTYEAKSAMRVFEQNYLSPDKDGLKPSINWFIDPMLKASSNEQPNIFNPDKQDYFVITCPEEGGGPSNESMPLILYGEPLSEFVYPVIPGQYNSQYKMLKRIAGVFAPVPAAVKVIKGFGVQNT